MKSWIWVPKIKYRFLTENIMVYVFITYSLILILFFFFRAYSGHFCSFQYALQPFPILRNFHNQQWIDFLQGFLNCFVPHLPSLSDFLLGCFPWPVSNTIKCTQIKHVVFKLFWSLNVTSQSNFTTRAYTLQWVRYFRSSIKNQKSNTRKLPPVNFP